MTRSKETKLKENNELELQDTGLCLLEILALHVLWGLGPESAETQHICLTRHGICRTLPMSSPTGL